MRQFIYYLSSEAGKSPESQELRKSEKCQE